MTRLNALKPFRFLSIALVAVILTFGLGAKDAHALGGIPNFSIPGIGSIGGSGASINIPGLGTIGIGWGSGGFTISFGQGGCGGNTIGSVMCNVWEATDLIPGLLSGIAYLFGLYLGVIAILKLRDHVENPNQTPLSESMKRFIAGGAFFALPMVMEAAYNTVAQDIFAPTATGFNATQTVGGGLDAMVAALVMDISGPIHLLFGAFCYLAGIVFILIGISRLLKSAQEGPRGPAGFGTMMTFIVGGTLLSFDAIMGAFTGSLFATDTITTYAELNFDSGMSADELNHIHTVVSSVLAFMMIIGWISFIRGWFIIRDVAEGSHQASLMAGMTHVLGGALAVNLGPVLNAVQETFGITGYGILFT
ncbi:hypothetical protein [Micavibrio aeruginosavorus]|uniref:Uncharacterized protein n=1 Tax=Micavibrio aeruginosavorus EPB TaxID=349215 RepID=M4VIW9_9BACT|nr:hypothetical protein [Micavibrio aeruginosavorus]AGH99158.1 hypothetical protein A11S_2363 [Micavibrio aeruginosavorus EPB]